MYKINIRAEDGYIYAHVTGKESLENSWAYWREIAAAGAKHGVKKVLVEDYLEGEISALDIHTFAKGFTERTGIPLGTRIASVSLPEKLPAQRFAETVVLNWAGVTVKVFTDINEAKKWLFAQA
jgi:hypothetical protein